MHDLFKINLCVSLKFETYESKEEYTYVSFMGVSNKKKHMNQLRKLKSSGSVGETKKGVGGLTGPQHIS